MQHLSLLNYINENINPEKIYYYATDGRKFWYNNKLKEYAPENLIVIKNFPDHFGFIKSQIMSSKKLINNFNFESFDLIIDNQTRITNSLIYKMLPHKHYISPCYNYFLSRPLFLMNKPKHIIYRTIKYLNKFLNVEKNINYNFKIPQIFLDEANKILKNDKEYIGFSITAAHRHKIKEFNLEEIIKVAHHFSNKYVPIFYIDKTYEDLKEFIKKKIDCSLFPEELAKESLKKPILVTALGSLTKFNISIDNGIAHMLSYSNNKNYIFYPGNSEKFKSLDKNCLVYDCKEHNKNMKSLDHKNIINFIEKNLN